MKLYLKPGACSLAAHIVLEEIGAPYRTETVDTDAGRTATGADFAAINPNGYVPALELDGGAVLTESAAVLQYLGDQAPGLVPPAGSLDRARLHEMLSFLGTELHKAFGPLFSGRDLSPDERAATFARIARRAGHVERLLGDGRDWLVGARFSVADAYAFTILNWAGFVGFPLTDLPHIAAYLARIRARPAVQAALAAEGLLDGEAA